MAVYAAMVDSIDQNIGRILKTVKETGAADDTVIFVLNDNGGCAGKRAATIQPMWPGPRNAMCRAELAGPTLRTRHFAATKAGSMKGAYRRRSWPIGLARSKQVD